MNYSRSELKKMSVYIYGYKYIVCDYKSLDIPRICIPLKYFFWIASLRSNFYLNRNPGIIFPWVPSSNKNLDSTFGLGPKTMASSNIVFSASCKQGNSNLQYEVATHNVNKKPRNCFSVLTILSTYKIKMFHAQYEKA